MTLYLLLRFDNLLKAKPKLGGDRQRLQGHLLHSDTKSPHAIQLKGLTALAGDSQSALWLRMISNGRSVAVQHAGGHASIEHARRAGATMTGLRDQVRLLLLGCQDDPFYHRPESNSSLGFNSFRLQPCFDPVEIGFADSLSSSMAIASSAPPAIDMNSAPSKPILISTTCMSMTVDWYFDASSTTWGRISSALADPSDRTRILLYISRPPSCVTSFLFGLLFSIKAACSKLISIRKTSNLLRIAVLIEGYRMRSGRGRLIIIDLSPRDPCQVPLTDTIDPL